MKRSDEFPWGQYNLKFYRTMRFLFGWIVRAIYPIRLENADRIPADGPAILCGNHRSFIDPVLMMVGVKRPISFMAKKSLFGIFFLRWLLPRMNAFPVDRTGVQMGGVRVGLSVLNDGGILGVFPEGTRSRTGRMGHAFDGIGMFAHKTGAPLIPVALVVKGKKPQPFRRTVIRVGTPVTADENAQDVKTEYARVTQEAMTQLTALLEKQ